MNPTEAINRIVHLLGLKFKQEKFFKTVLEDGQTEVTNNQEGELQVGQTLYVIGEATLQPAPTGTHKTRDGITITVDEESTITKLEVMGSEVEVEREEDDMETQEGLSFTEARDAQGQILSSPTFDVGEKVMVVHSDGTETPAPDGEHQVVLKDTSGNENKIRIQTKDGVITQRENVEEMMEEKMSQEDFSKFTTEFSKQIEEIKQGVTEVLKVVDGLNGKFKTDINTLRGEFEQFKNSPERKPIEKKTEFKEDFNDFKLEFLKELRNK